MSPRSVVTRMLGWSDRPRLVLSICGTVVVLAITLVLLTSLALATPDFPDVPATNPYYTAINDLASRGVIGGYTDGDFGPNDPVTRQQFAKMAVLTGGYPVSETDVCPFADVGTGDATTFYPDNYVAVCAAKGITTGKTTTTFDPYSNITRYQVVTMVVRMADDLEPGLLATPLAGFSATGAWGNNAIHGANAARAEYNDLLTGLDLASLDPNGNMSRAEVAQVLYDLLSLLSPSTTANPFAEAVHASPTALPASVETIVVESGGESWTLPAAVCLRAEGDTDIVLTAAKQQVAIVHTMVGPLISGWPTTTYRPRTDEEQATWSHDLWTAGVAALTLAGLLGEQAALEQAWVDYEQGFADSVLGWGAPTHISSRVEQWKMGAQTLTDAITAYCSAE